MAVFERALAEAMTDSLPVPIRQIMNPTGTPAAFLPFLAAHRSVDLWFENWSEARKRLMVANAARLAALVGTRAAAEAFLAFVDAQIIHKVSHPANRPLGQFAVGIHPIGHKPFTARFLVKVELKLPKNAFVVGRSAIGKAAFRPVDLEPQRRANLALSVSKAPETEYSVSYAHRVPISLDDGFDLHAGHVLGSYKDRLYL